MLISQHSDEDTITLEITREDTTLILASMYWDRQKAIEQDLTKVDKILKPGIREGVIIAMDSNARSTTWHDTTTNRGKQLLILKDNQTEKQIEDFSEGMRIACEQSFNTNKARKGPQKNKSVPWWTHERTAAKKITNFVRRKCQRTRDNAEQGEINKEACFAKKAKYAATKKGENQIVERILHSNNRSQPLECGV